MGKATAAGGAADTGPDSLFGPDLQRGANPKRGPLPYADGHRSDVALTATGVPIDLTEVMTYL